MATQAARRDEQRVTDSNLIDMQNNYDVDSVNHKRNVGVVDFSKRILRASNVSLIGGPFHYSIRSGMTLCLYNLQVCPFTTPKIYRFNTKVGNEIILQELMGTLMMRSLGKCEWEWPNLSHEPESQIIQMSVLMNLVCLWATGLRNEETGTT